MMKGGIIQLIKTMHGSWYWKLFRDNVLEVESRGFRLEKEALAHAEEWATLTGAKVE